MSSGIKVVLCFLTISALLGFTQVPIAEGAVSWNGFLKQVGFNPPTVYEVSDTVVIPAGDTSSSLVTILCLEGDWSNNSATDNLQGSLEIVTEPFISGRNFEPDIVFKDGDPRLKAIGYRGTAFLQNAQLFDVEFTITILCLSPSSFQTVGGEWQATDTTALIIGYSVLNAYWIAPIGIGIGVGIYLVKRKI